MNFEHRQVIRVAIIVPALRQLGPVKVMEAMVNALSAVPDLFFKVFYMDKTVDPRVKFSAPVERLNRSHFRFSEFDIIHTNGIRPDLFAWFNRRKIKYHISTIHNFVFEDLSFTYHKLISFIFGNIWLLLWKRSDKLVGISESMKRYYVNWFDASKMEVVYNGIPETDILVKPDSDVIQLINEFREKGLKVICCAGILTRRKGIDQLLWLLAEAKENALVIIGDGKEVGSLKRLSQKLGISDRCHFCGFRNDAIKYFKYFDIFIMPSRSEGFGLTLIEAVQQKVPVICSDLEVFKELFNKDEVTFFKLDDIGSLSEAMKESEVNGKMKTDLAYKRYLSNYTADIMAKKYFDFYQSVLVTL